MASSRMAFAQAVEPEFRLTLRTAPDYKAIRGMRTASARPSPRASLWRGIPKVWRCAELLNQVPTRCFMTKGKGIANEKLTSFEMALREAGISQFNLVRVSSIFPPKCKIVSREEGLREMDPGQIVFAVISQNETNEPYRQIAASCGLAMPRNRDQYGYISEHHSFGETERKAGDYAEDLAASMLATILGVDFDPDDSYDARKEQWKISGQIYRTSNVTETARGNARGKWTTVVTAVVLIP